MRNPERIPVILELLERIWSLPKFRDLRFWQLLLAIKHRFGIRDGEDLFFVEDDNTHLLLRTFFNDEIGGKEL